ncbi:MAG: Rpp14/Pop5 family protein [Nitrososphaerota archaeon]
MKKRYLLVRIFPQQVEVKPEELREAVAEELSRIGGWSALAEAGISVKRYRHEGGEFLIRCSLRSLSIVLLSLTLIKGIRGKKVRLDVTKIGGTIRGLRE